MSNPVLPRGEGSFPWLQTTAIGDADPLVPLRRGDSVIWVAEQMLLASLGINIQYQCGVRDFEMSALQETVDKWGEDHFAIVFHGGGNFGDLYDGEHGLKLHVMRVSSPVFPSLPVTFPPLPKPSPSLRRTGLSAPQ